MHESPAVNSASPSSLDVINTVFAEASKPENCQEAGGSGDAADSSLAVKSGDAGGEACCGNMLYQTAGMIPHAGGGDDLGMSPVALLSNQTEAQLQELLRQQQWHVRLNQMMQLDVMQQQSQAPLVIGADTAASLLWHQQQQHVANPTTVSFAFCSDQVTQQQQQQLLLQQQQQQQPQPQATVEMKYDIQQQQQVQTKPAGESQQMQSPRQQKPRLIARGN